MIKYLMKKFALTERGAKGFLRAVAACTLEGLALMIPVSLLHYLTNDLMKGAVPSSHYYLYGFGIPIALALIFLTAFFKYNATYFSTYRESGVKRVRLSEKLRKLPLSFFGKKDLADLTNTVMGDVQVTEQMMSHYVPQFYGSVISALFVSIGMLVFDWRMALAALWVFPISLIIVGFSKKVQNHFTRRQNEATVAILNGIQGKISETFRDLKSNNAEKKYLEGLNNKISKMEGRQIKSELGSAMFVVPAQMILKLGIASVALVGSILLMDGTLSAYHILYVSACRIARVRTVVGCAAKSCSYEQSASKYRSYE